MIPAAIAHMIVVTCGAGYRTYRSYKTIRSGNTHEYVAWMTYWTVFAGYLCLETVIDLLISQYFELYYEFKVLFILWLLNPYTKGARILYKKIVHLTLSQYEHEIEEYADFVVVESWETVLRFIRAFLIQITSLLINIIKNVL